MALFWYEPCMQRHFNILVNHFIILCIYLPILPNLLLIFIALLNNLVNLSECVMMLLAFERMLAVLFPLRAKSILGVRFTISLLFFVGGSYIIFCGISDGNLDLPILNATSFFELASK